MLLQIHDEIIFQIPLNKSCTFEDHAVILSDILNSLEPTLTTTNGQDFVIPAELTMLRTLYAVEDGKQAPGTIAGSEDLKRVLNERSDKIKFAALLRSKWGVINDRFGEESSEGSEDS